MITPPAFEERMYAEKVELVVVVAGVQESSSSVDGQCEAERH